MNLPPAGRRPHDGRSPSAIYKILTNSFYAGVIEWEGRTYPGKHDPMVTLSEFEKVQELLGRPGRPRRKRYDFPYTGLIRCGECGFMVTAENKVNRFGSRYTYYHCSKRRLDYRCTQSVVTAEYLEGQVARFLEEVSLPKSFFRLGVEELERQAAHNEGTVERQRRTLELRATEVDRQLRNLAKLRIREVLDDAVFLTEREELTRERIRIAQELNHRESAELRFEPARDLISFNNGLAPRFLAESNDGKRVILETVGSNPVLLDRELKIDVAKPFRRWSATPTNSELRAYVREVRTFVEIEDSAEASKNIKLLASSQ